MALIVMSEGAVVPAVLGFECKRKEEVDCIGGEMPEGHVRCKVFGRNIVHLFILSLYIYDPHSLWELLLRGDHRKSFHKC